MTQSLYAPSTRKSIAAFRYHNCVSSSSTTTTTTTTTGGTNFPNRRSNNTPSVITKLSRFNRENLAPSITTNTLHNNNNAKNNNTNNNSHNNKYNPFHWQRRLFVLWISLAFMGLLSVITFGLLATKSTAASAINSNNNSYHLSPGMVLMPYNPTMMKDRVRAALWSYFAGDALASPTHWFYGGFPQVQRYYGKAGITGYQQPVYELAGSILNKSNLSGGGRATTTFMTSRSIGMNGDSSSNMPKTIIGHVINHGKQDLWDPSKQIHYHATLKAGENTLEVQLARVLMKSIVATNGKFDADHFRKAYVQFMTTPNSHNDTYASTCHRMFFANYIYKQLPPEQCPDNDHHNVDTIDGLVLPTITALAVASRPDGTVQEAAQQSAATAAVTRASTQLERYAAAWGQLVFETVRAGGSSATSTDTTATTTTNNNIAAMAATTMASQLRLRTPQARANDEITACYLEQAVPALLDGIVKYSSSTSGSSSTVWNALLANANTGGENVHRGSCLGAVLGASAAASASDGNSNPLEPKLISGLYDHASLEQEIQTFLDSVTTTAAAASNNN